MSKGPGTVMRRVIARLRREKARGFVRAGTIARDLRLPRSTVRRALLAMQRRGEVISVGGPRRWALIKGKRTPRAKPEELNIVDVEEVLAPEQRGSVNVPYGGLTWP